MASIGECGSRRRYEQSLPVSGQALAHLRADNTTLHTDVSVALGAEL